jgi:hypothetical protein
VSPTLWAFDVYDTATQTMCSDYVRVTEGHESGCRSVPLRYVWPAEVDLMAQLAGLRLRERWGGWTRVLSHHVKYWALSYDQMSEAKRFIHERDGKNQARFDIRVHGYGRAAVLKYPDRNVQLRHGARIIERHDGAPPTPPLVERDPNLKSWSAHLIGGRKMQSAGLPGSRHRGRRHRAGGGSLQPR